MGAGRDGTGRLRLRLLDGFAVAVDGRPIPDGAWRSRKARQLLKLLALAPGHRVHRDEALEALWPDLTAAGATKALYQALFVLRRTLEPHLRRGAASRFVRLDRDRVVLVAPGGVETDLAAFEHAAARALGTGAPTDIQTALSLGSEVLPDDRYEEWTQAWRRALLEQRLALLASLAAAHERAGQLEDAAAVLRRVLELEPAHEPAHAGLMRLYAAVGRRDEALRQYERLKGVLRQELGATPDAETQRLHAALLAGPPPSMAPAAATTAAAAESPRALTAAQPAPAPPGLPRQLTSFVGREADVAEVARLLEAAPLVTLTGPGGVGKTRLALEVAGRAAAAWPDGAGFVDLAPLAEPGLVPHAVAAALGVREAPGRPLLGTLTDALGSRRLLLLLDNCEHLLEACARLADALLRACPGARLLATSRERLGVPGEAAYRVPSLAVPDPDRPTPAALLAQVEAVRLFVERARAVQPAFSLTTENAPAVAEVCRRLDGIPLALELAAARVRVLTPEQLAARLGDRFRLLTGGGRTALRRQQTLRATVDWSHDLLAEPERALFRRLAAFPGGAAGGFPLEAAEAVGAGGAGDPVEGVDVLDLLTGLVDKSLVLAEARGAAERYRLLETLRQYAEDKLLQAGEAGAVRDRHAAWCLALARAAATAAERRYVDTPARRRLRAERENVRAALAWCASTPAAAPTGLQLLADAGQMFVGETLSEARRWLETFLGLVPARTVARARCLLELDTNLRWHHEFARAGDAVREARAIFVELGDADGAALAAALEGLVAASLGDYDRGVALIAPALARARERGDQGRVEQFSRDVGLIAVARRDFTAARERLEESLALAERRGAATLVALGRLRLAALDRLEGDYPRARARLEALRRNAAPLAGPGGRPGATQEAVQSLRTDLLPLALGCTARAEGRYDEARTLIHGALRRLHRGGEGAFLLSAACMAGMLEIARGAPARGVTLIAACARGEGPIGTIHMPDVRVEVPDFLEQARQTLGGAGYATAWAAGQAMTLEQAVAYALEEAGGDG